MLSVLKLTSSLPSQFILNGDLLDESCISVQHSNSPYACNWTIVRLHSREMIFPLFKSYTIDGSTLIPTETRRFYGVNDSCAAQTVASLPAGYYTFSAVGYAPGGFNPSN